MKHLIKITFFAVCLFSLVNTTEASHLAGADLTYTCMGNNVYEVKATLYRDCSGIPAPTNLTVNYSSQSCGFLGGIVSMIPVPGTGQEITQPCQSAQSICIGGTVPGIQKWEYTGIVTLPMQCSDWVFDIDQCCRNAAITTLVSPGSYSMYVPATLNNLGFSCNNSPFFSNDPILYLCVNQGFVYNHGVTDPDGDSLHYSLVDPMRDAIIPVSFLPGYDAMNPILSSPAMTLDAGTGDINIHPTQAEIGVMAVLVEEYRNDSLIGSVVRDMQIWTNGCSNTLPSASGINGSNDYSMTVCPGDSVIFFMQSIDPDSQQNVTMSWNNGISNGIFYTSQGPRPTGFFEWVPGFGDVGLNSFTVTVQDDACPMNGVQVYSYNIYVSSPLFTVNTTSAICGGGGSATVIHQGDVVSFQWSTGDTTESVLGLSQGTYSVTVTDTAGCQGSQNFYINGGGGTIAVVDSTVDAGCDSSCSGAAYLFPMGGSAPYTVWWSNGGQGTVLTGLCAGVYTYNGYDAFGCQFNGTVVIAGGNNTLAVVANDVDQSCSGACDGYIDNTVTGGTPPYSFQWSTGDTTEDIYNLCSGIYPVTISDANGCSIYDCQIISTSNYLYVSGTTTDVSCMGGCDGAIDLTVTTWANYTVQWSNGATTDDISGLCPGTYWVTVTADSGCSTTDTFNIQGGFGQPIAIVSNTSDETCAGACDGSIDVTAVGGTAPYSYSWSNGSTNEDLTNLCPGAYHITVTDANGCSATVCVVVDGADTLNISYTAQDVSCYGMCDGSIDVTVTGGTGPYTFDWWQSNLVGEDQTGLCEGMYDLTVTDANGCTDWVWITIHEPQPIAAFTSANDETCPGACDGSVSVNASGGTAPYSYNWSNGSTQSTASGLCAGMYHVTITDANGCSVIVCDSVGSGYINVTATGIDASCFGSCDGIGYAVGTGGTPPYTFSWSNGNNQPTVTNLCPGSHTVTMTDANGCQTSATISIGAPAPIYLATAAYDATCAGGGCDGWVDLEVYGGVGNLSYNWSNGATVQDPTGLCPGSYEVTVTDDNGCEATTCVTIEGSGLDAVVSAMDASCGGTCDGYAIISPLGGSAPYTIQWSNGQSGYTAGNLCPGTYTVQVTDAQGCTYSETVQIGGSSSMAVNYQVQHTSTLFSCDGSVSLNVTGGSAPYTFSWSNGETSQNLNALCRGYYTVEIIDANGCSITETIRVRRGYGGVSNPPNWPFVIKPKFKLAPNPTVQDVTISMEKGEIKGDGEDVLYEVLDHNGDRILSGKLELTNSEFHTTISMSDYAAGTYLINLSVGEILLTTEKVVKVD